MKREFDVHELNLYTNYNYRKIVKRANLYFNKKYLWYSPRNIFAPQYGNYTISFYKKNIRICCWQKNDDNEEYQNTKNFIKEFLDNNLKNDTIGITFNQNCDILDLVNSIKTIQIQ